MPKTNQKYIGELSKFLGDIFLDKEFLLFDTFEGFVERDTVLEKKHNLSDISEKIVLSKIKNLSRVKIYKDTFQSQQ